MKSTSALAFLALTGLMIVIFVPSTNPVALAERLWKKGILTPLSEEIFFRLFPHLLIYSMQQGLHQLRQDGELTEDQKKWERINRIVISALVFCLIHVTQNPKRVPSIHGPITLLGGIVYAGLLEKYRTLSIGIYFHGMNNLISSTFSLFPTVIYLYLVYSLNHCLGIYVLWRSK